MKKRTLLMLLLVITPNLAPAAAPDLFIRDTADDDGVEPGPINRPTWTSPDIWNRGDPDPNYEPYPFPKDNPLWTPGQRQNPHYRDPKLSKPNYLYVRVTNRGDAPSTGSEELHVYWARSQTQEWPAQWNDYLSGGTLRGTEITKPRKNAATASTAERDAYVAALLSIDSSFEFGDSVSYWDKQDHVHQLAPLHGAAGFLAWHREFVNRFEILLREADPTVTLLYWDWTKDPADSDGFNFFTDTFMGSGSGRVGAPFETFDADSDCETARIGTGYPQLVAICRRNGDDWRRPPPILYRTAPGGAPGVEQDDAILDRDEFNGRNRMRENLESLAHDPAHAYLGGNMAVLPEAAEDPFFFLLHGNVDRLWAMWQRSASDPDSADPSRLDPTVTYGGESDDGTITATLGPWDGGDSIYPWTEDGRYRVSKTPKHASIVFPPIYDTAPLLIPVLQPDESVIIEIPWYPQRALLAGCDVKSSVALLARIVGDADGSAPAEGAKVAGNARVSNDIASRSVTVQKFPHSLDCPLAVSKGSVELRGGSIGGRVGLVLAEALPGLSADSVAESPEGLSSSFLNFGTVILDLKSDLFQRWIQGGSRGQGIRVVGPTQLRVLTPNASIENIALGPNEEDSVDVQFELGRGYPHPAGRVFDWDVSQYTAVGTSNQLIGGERFNLDFNKIFLIEKGAMWKYLDDGTDPGSAWRQPGFNDAAWKSGEAELGFGDKPETEINGGPTNNRIRTVYFRHPFMINDPAFFTRLLLRLKRDDGCAVYLNGAEIFRTNLPSGTITFSTLATRTVGGLEEEVFFPVNVSTAIPRLVAGTNILCAEVHQASATSSDLSFDLELCGNVLFSNQPPEIVFTTPAHGDFFQRGQAISLVAEALDVDGTVTKIELYADGVKLSEIAAPPFATLVWSNASLGLHRLKAVAYDASGLVGETQVRINVVSNLVPHVAITSPADGTMFEGGQSFTVTATATDIVGAVAAVEFYAREHTLFVAPDILLGSDTTTPYSVTVSNLPPGHYRLTAVARDNSGEYGSSAPLHVMVHEMMTPPATNITLIATGSAWKYLDDGSDPGAVWRSNTFNDSAWLSGPAELGYGDGDEATLVRSNRTDGTRITTTYFRRAFTLAEPFGFTNLIVRLRRDDGGVVYLNGIEVFRNNMPLGPVDYLTRASLPIAGADETAFFSANVSPSALRGGANIVAVEIHQINPTNSSDISFELELIGQYGNSVAPAAYLGGVLHSPLGNATLSLRSSGLRVTPLGHSGSDGVTIEVGEVESASVALGRIEPSAWPTGASLTVRAVGLVNRVPDRLIGAMQVVNLGGATELSFDYSPLAPQAATFQVFDGTNKVGEATLPDPRPRFRVQLPPEELLAFVLDLARRLCEPLWGVVELPGRPEIRVPGLPPLRGNRVVVSPRSGNPDPEPALPAIGFVSRLEVLGQHVGPFEITGVELGMFHHDHVTAGQTRLLGADNTLRLLNLGTTGQDGVDVALERVDRFSLRWRDLNTINPPPLGAMLEARFRGAFAGRPEQDLGQVRVSRLDPRLTVTADYSAAGITSRRIEVLRSNVVVATVTGNTGLVARVQDWPVGCGKLAPPLLSPRPPLLCIWLEWPVATPIELGLGGGVFSPAFAQTVLGDELRIVAENAPAPLDYLSEFALRAAGIPEIVLMDETSGLPALNIVRAGSQITLSWMPHLGVLQQADAITGPWFDVPNATNPLALPAGAARKFYRLRL